MPLVKVMPRKDSNAPMKRIPTKSEVKEPTNKLIKAIALSDQTPIKSADKLYSTNNEVVLSSTFESSSVIGPSGKSIQFDRIIPMQ